MKDSCYILQSGLNNKIYIGYTNNFNRRLRQHNGEIKGGAKKTKFARPWYPICHIEGFEDASSALRFEYRLQRSWRRKKNEDVILYTLCKLSYIINNGDGSESKIKWPILKIKWFDRYPVRYKIDHPNVINEYCLFIEFLKDV